jgi:LysR family transcriptional regulator, glycine cleavage system transcriptional activator
MGQLRLSLTAMRALDVLAHSQSLTETARELNVTPSAVSQLISTLERRLGVKLVERGGARVRLTETGRRYARALHGAFRKIDRATESLAKELLPEMQHDAQQDPEQHPQQDPPADLPR